MKCFIKAGLFATAAAMMLFAVLLPVLGDILVSYGPDVLTRVGRDGVRCLSHGTSFSMFLTGTLSLIGSFFVAGSAVNIKCD